MGLCTKPHPSSMSWVWGHGGRKIQHESLLKMYLVHFLRFTENPGDPHKVLKLQCTGFLKMTLKWAYFIMLNTTIFSCDTELVRNLEICPRSPLSSLFWIQWTLTPTQESKLVVRCDLGWVLFWTWSIFSNMHVLALDNLMVAVNNQLINKYFWSICDVLSAEILSLSFIK